jgi:ribosomal-protein-alanine N-acetyltransferase
MLPSDVTIRELRIDDASALAQAYERNRRHLAPWDPARMPSFYTEAGQVQVVDQQLTASARGQFLGWVLVRDEQILGRVNLNNVVMGPFRSAAVGYWVDLDQQGRGLATGAVHFACERALEHGLHRVEASTLVHNTASQAVLARSGFELYGLAPAYLHIDGRWQDHRLFQRILYSEV